MTEDLSMTNYVVATIKEWNFKAFEKHVLDLPGNWQLISSPEELTVEAMKAINPRYIFFPHWSWIVPVDVLDAFECVCFHMTDVPYGRGGSPLQNLIAHGHTQTKLTALRMVQELDAGPVYGKLCLNLDGRAEDIFSQVAELCYEHISEIVAFEPTPIPQKGEAVCFPRRRPKQSELPKNMELSSLYDHIRMLDAPSYPKAYIDYGNYRIEFSQAEIVDGCLHSNVTLIPKTK